MVIPPEQMVTQVEQVRIPFWRIPRRHLNCSLWQAEMAALERVVKQARLAVSGLAVKEVAEAVATHLGLMAPMATIPVMGA